MNKTKNDAIRHISEKWEKIKPDIDDIVQHFNLLTAINHRDMLMGDLGMDTFSESAKLEGIRTNFYFALTAMDEFKEYVEERSEKDERRIERRTHTDRDQPG